MLREVGIIGNLLATERILGSLHQIILWKATALGRAACELGKRVRYANTARLTTELKQAKTEVSLIKELKKLEKTDLLNLDDFGLQVLDATGRSLLMDVMEDRHGRKSTMVVGQIPITSWHEVIGDLTLADALMDRWVHGSYQIELDGELKAHLN